MANPVNISHHVARAFGVLGNAFRPSEVIAEHFEFFVRDPQVANEVGGLVGAGTWAPIRFLGQGSSGNAAVFGQFDAAGVLQARIVVKEVRLNHGTWLHPLWWAPRATDFNANGDRDYTRGVSHAESAETYIHNKLSNQGSDSIVHYVDRSPVDVPNWRYRVLTEYCGLGTLTDIIRYYRNPANFPDHDVLERWGTPKVGIPEPFIWYCFSQLVKAAMIMERGSTTAGTVVAGWRPIIHRDIKPDNIWLHDPPTAPGSEFQLYPIPKLGDMGTAVETTATEPTSTNPRLFRGMGTKGFFAPDQKSWVNENDRDHFDQPPLGTATNVWAIGMIIYCLVYRITNPRQVEFDRDGPIEPAPAPQGPYMGKPALSGRLTSLMRECLSFDPAQRPALDDLWEHIHSKYSDEDYFKNMRVGAAARPNRQIGETWLSTKRGKGRKLAKFDGPFVDAYRTGLNRALLPPL